MVLSDPPQLLPHTQTPLSLFRMWTIEQLLNQLSIIRIDPLQALPCTQYTGKESTHKTRHGNLIISCYFLIECWWVVFAYWDILALYLTNIGCRMQIMRLILSMSDDRILWWLHIYLYWHCVNQIRVSFMHYIGLALTPLKKSQGLKCNSTRSIMCVHMSMYEP